jgi:uncharacterized protein YndB with AHSA1/START domain
MTDQTNKTVTFTRLLEAPPAVVFPLWIEARHLSQWFAPRHFTVPDCTVDARVGGEIRLTMQTPDGTRYPMKAVFEELVANQRIVTRNWAGFDAEGKPGFETLQTYGFADEGGKTRLTVRAEVIWMDPRMAPAIAGMEEGWKQTLEKLEGVVAGVSG